jgi:hypothetical protein
MTLEEIEERWSYGTGVELDWDIAKEDVDWLISKVKELERQVKFLEVRNKDLTDDLKKERAMLDHCREMYRRDCDK